MSIYDQELHRKLDELLELAPTIRALGKVLVRSHVAAKALDLNKDTLSQSPNVDKYEEVGSRRTFVSVSDLAVVKKRKR